MNKFTKIKEVTKGSLADSWGICPGDFLVAINDVEIEDVFDYYYQLDNLYVTITVANEEGETKQYAGEKDPDEDIGLVFEEGLLDDYKSCSNKCIFCFIDQMPPGMRETLYFKDDDTRLSFLQGNYATLTNMKEKDFERIEKYRLAPINVSVHTTNPELRCEMLNNRFAGKIMDQLKRLYDSEIEMNGQVVLCKDINDKDELDRTIGDLLSLYPQMQSMSVVPLGVTKYREGLRHIEPYNKEDALKVIAQIEKWQSIAMEKHGVHFVQASDEWYLTAELPFPEESVYDGYIQLENGVGMMRLLHEEFMYALECERIHPFIKKKNTIATGKLAAPMMEELSAECNKKYKNVHTNVVTIRNDFFGETITVSGLITGKDLINQLKGRDLGDRLLIPINMLRSGEETFLDDVTVSEVSETLQIPVVIVKSSGDCLLSALLGQEQREM